jgi:heme oxygenase
MSTPETASLAALLRAETKEAHTASERSGLMSRLLRGQIDRSAYALLLRSLYEIYAALETELAAHATHPVVAALYDRRLDRLWSLEQDLEFLAPGAWRDLPIAPAAAAYAERLHALAGGDPELLIAHAYVRYLGDVHGGQILGRIVRKALALENNAGTSFYDFSIVGDLHTFIGEYRARIDAVPVDAAGRQRIASEALDGFRRHIVLFEELAAMAPPALGQVPERSGEM